MSTNLQSENLHLRKLLSLARLGWWEADFTTHRYQYPEELAELLGLPETTITFDDFHQLIHRDYRENICNCIRSFPETGSFQHPFLLISPRYGEMWVYLKLVPSEINEGRVLSASGYLQLPDTKPDGHLSPSGTKPKKDIRANYFHNKYVKDLFNKLPVGIELYDKDGYLIAINDQDMEIFGLQSKEEPLGKNLFDNPNMPAEVLESLRQGKDLGFTIRYNFALLSTYNPTNSTGFKDITVKNVVLRDSTNDIEGYLFIIIDNTDQELALAKIRDFENVFKMISEYARIGYAKLNPTDRTGYAIDQWFRNYGEPITSDLRDVVGVYGRIHPEDRKKILAFYEDAFKGKQSYFKAEVRILQPDGGWKWIHSNIIVSKYQSDPAEIELIGVNYDISELKGIQVELMEAKNKAETMDRLKSAFLANMSHEIRTPLNAIVGFSRLLSEDLSHDDRMQYMNIVEENNELLLQLISDILDLSKIEAGTFEFIQTEVDAHQLCEDIIQAMKLKVTGSVELIFETQDKECYLISDKHRLQQVISNFINNALKFTSSGSIRLGYQIKGEEVEFYVQDSGIGIPASKQPSVFDRFVKLNNMAQGTGLGLSICKSIVEQFGGHIGVSSEEGTGSRFWFTHPFNPDKQHTGKETEIQEQESAEDTDISRKPCILIAEDTDSNYLLLYTILKKEYELLRVTNGREAIELCSRITPDIILMDVRMPHVNGLEATRQIRRSHPTLPILAVTAFAFDQDRLDALAAGCNDVLTKPVSTPELKAALKKWLNQ